MKINKTLKIIVLLSVITLIIIIACDPSIFEDGCHSHVKIKNNSKIDICTGANNSIYSLCDTTIHAINPLRRGRKVIEGKTGQASGGIGCAGCCIESRFVDYDCEYLIIFIFDAKFMEDNLKDEGFRVNENMALQRYDLTLEDLNSLKWTVPYPPDERMKDMNMYPSYGSE